MCVTQSDFRSAASIFGKNPGKTLSKLPTKDARHTLGPNEEIN